MGLTPAGALLWARSQGLPSKKDRRLSEEEHERRRQAYESSRTTAEAAERLGLSVAAFRAWRHKEGLPAKPPRGPMVPEDEEQRRVEAHRVSGSDTEAAAQLGMAVSSFRAWRSSRGLPPSGSRP